MLHPDACALAFCFLHPGGQEDKASSLHLGSRGHPSLVFKPARTLAVDLSAHENAFLFSPKFRQVSTQAGEGRGPSLKHHLWGCPC